MVGGEGLQAGQGICVATERQQRLEPALHGAQVGLGELHDAALRDLVVGDLGQRVTAPQGDRFIEGLEPLERFSAAEQVTPALGPGAQSVGVDRVGRDVHQVAGAAGGQGGPEPGGSQSLPKVGHVRRAA